MDLKILEKYHVDGLVLKQTHPTLPLTIWNYSPKVQYEQLWDEILLQTRGLVTDDKGNVVARPFKKFFNLEEGKHTPTKEFEVFEKMDGSLGILFRYKNQLVCATRGSFTSEQAIWMQNFVNKYYDLDFLINGITYLFEIIYPENRIVVDYKGEDKLVLLGMIETSSGKEIPYDDYINWPGDLVVRHDGIRDYTALKSKISSNQEGYVIRFSNGDRCKIKGEEYLRLHKIMTNLSTVSIWECLKNNIPLDTILKDVPDEFYGKIKEYEKFLLNRYEEIEQQCTYHYKRNIEGIANTRKEAAFIITELPFSSVLFKMWDGKPYFEIIWNIIKPKYKKI